MAEIQLRDLILEIFREKGDLTIAGMVRELEARGVKHHRLTVTGYLHALVDTEYLEVRSVPPAKLFSLRSSPMPSLPTVVGDAARRVAPSNAKALELTVASLERVLDRPVFLSELTEAGFTRTGALKQLGKRERTEVARRLERCGVTDRTGEPMFRARDAGPGDIDRVVRESLLDALGSQGERPREVKQTSLTLEQFG